MTVAAVSSTAVTQAVTAPAPVTNVTPPPAPNKQDDTSARTPVTDNTTTQPSNPVNVASTPVPQNTTPPVYSAVGNANASTIRGSGVDIVT